jgi:DNA-binding transcriptional LysR family regulator
VTFRLGFVTGATPDKWAGTWRERQREPIELVPVTEDVQEHGIRTGALDMALVRLPVDRDGLHLIPLYEELPVAVMNVDDALTLLDEVTTDDLADEHQDWTGLTVREAVETVAAGTGVLVVPMSVARLHHRKDVTYRTVTDLPPTQVGLAWLQDNDDPRVQTFIGIVRGRTANSSRD